MTKSMSENPSRAELIRRKLVVSEDEIFGDHLDRIQNYIMLDSSGKVHFRFGKTKLNQRTAIALYLTGKFFAHEAGLADSSDADLDELTSFLGADTKTVSSRLSELKRSGKVESVQRGSYRISYVQVEKILEDLPMHPSEGRLK